MVAALSELHHDVHQAGLGSTLGKELLVAFQDGLVEGLLSGGQFNLYQGFFLLWNEKSNI